MCEFISYCMPWILWTQCEHDSYQTEDSARCWRLIRITLIATDSIVGLILKVDRGKGPITLPAGLDAGWCIYIRDLDQAWITSFTSSFQVLQTQQMTYKWMRAAFSLTLLPSRAQLAPVPGRLSVNALSSTQPGFSSDFYYWCKWPKYDPINSVLPNLTCTTCLVTMSHSRIKKKKKKKCTSFTDCGSKVWWILSNAVVRMAIIE